MNSSESLWIRIRIGKHWPYWIRSNPVILCLFAFLATLTKHDNMLRAMFSGRMEVLTDSDGWILIDRQTTSTLLRFLFFLSHHISPPVIPSFSCRIGYVVPYRTVLWNLIFLDRKCFNSIPVTSYICLHVLAHSVLQRFSSEQFRTQQRHIKYVLPPVHKNYYVKAH